MIGLFSNNWRWTKIKIPTVPRSIPPPNSEQGQNHTPVYLNKCKKLYENAMFLNFKRFWHALLTSLGIPCLAKIIEFSSCVLFENPRTKIFDEVTCVNSKKYRIEIKLSTFMVQIKCLNWSLVNAGCWLAGSVVCWTGINRFEPLFKSNGTM